MSIRVLARLLGGTHQLTKLVTMIFRPVPVLAFVVGSGGNHVGCTQLIGYCVGYWVNPILRGGPTLHQASKLLLGNHPSELAMEFANASEWKQGR